MTVKWGIAKGRLDPDYGATTGFNQRSKNVYLRVSDSHGGLSTRVSRTWRCDGYHGTINDGYQKLFDYWNEYGSPTEADIYMNYYAGDESRWRPKLQAYRQIINSDKPSFEQLLQSLYPLLDSLVDGDYEVNICDMLPTNGDGNYYYQYPGKTKITDWATPEMPLYQGYSSMEWAFPLYLMPTQAEQLTNLQNSEETVLRGMGITLRFGGFNNYLIDGHHKAKLAFEQRRVLPCINICRLVSGVNNISFHDFSNLSLKMDYQFSLISDNYFLDYPTTLDVIRAYDYFYEYEDWSPMEQLTDLQAIMAQRGLSEEEILRIIQGLFYSDNVKAYLSLEPTIRNDYPFPTIYRAYYGLLCNWLKRPGVPAILWQFLIDDLSDDTDLNNFIAERMLATGTV